MQRGAFLLIMLAMQQLTILSVGKTKESWLETAIQEYQKRLQGQLSIQMHLVKDDKKLLQEVEKASFVVCLDEAGKEPLSSPEFSKLFLRWMEQAGSRLTMVIGGADGLPAALKSGQYPLLSLSKLTLTHQMVRLLLVEQVYRAYEIARGSGYHR